KVTVNNGRIDIELHIAVDHGVNMRTVALSTMDEVRYVVEQQTGIKVGNVDVYVDAMTVGDDGAED
ncbi:MAG: Asp23/Gls24 family envelope stress response protein, partial [Eubacteriales bacterium]